MGLSASQGRLLLLTARRSDLELRAQSISQKRLAISQQLEEISLEYENATSNRQMKISLFLNGQNSDKDDVQRVSNLTYATLISGTLQQFSPSQSGIQAYSRTSDQEYASTSAYRLVDADGAIVVSDKSEIPGFVSVAGYETPALYSYKDSATNQEVKVNNVYRTGTKDENGRYTNELLYAVAQEGSPLSAFLAENGNEGICAAKIDTKNGLISVVSKNSTKFYNLDGTECTDDTLKNSFEGKDGALVGNTDQIPKVNVAVASKAEVVAEGSDGKYSVIKDGVVVARYLVDETLKYGSTDVNGATDGPNYLQDCLRNGKYLIEKGGIDQNGDIRWSSIAWDAVSNITDSYYTEDDDKAKAKYDRLQNQLQAQDKKLELELNNIETQRSAVTTEVESVQKIIDENVEGSFDTFG